MGHQLRALLWENSPMPPPLGKGLDVRKNVSVGENSLYPHTISLWLVRQPRWVEDQSWISEHSDERTGTTGNAMAQTVRSEQTSVLESASADACSVEQRVPCCLTRCFSQQMGSISECVMASRAVAQWSENDLCSTVPNLPAEPLPTFRTRNRKDMLCK